MACSHPHAKLRAAIVPSPAQQATEHAADHAHAQGAPARMSWARLLKRVFDIDIEHCPNCGGSLKIIAAIEDPAGDVRSSPIWACPPAHRRAHRRGDSICSKRPEPSTQTGSATEPAMPLGLCSANA